jgi:hypothetical protein
MNFKTDSTKKFGWKQIAIIAVILGVAAFKFYEKRKAEQAANGQNGGGVAQLDLDQELDLDSQLKKDAGSRQTPAGKPKLDFTGLKSESPKNSSSGKTTKPAVKRSSNDASPVVKKSTQPYLRSGSRGAKVSPAGLTYTSSRSGEHRTEHVLRHANDMPNRPGNHGVFDADGDDVFRLIDEAYGLIKKNSKQVRKDKPRAGEEYKAAYEVDMRRRIGYRGGKSGNRAGKPPLRKIKLVLADDRVITAYPY